jgi:hypothetical protein
VSASGWGSSWAGSRAILTAGFQASIGAES